MNGEMPKLYEEKKVNARKDYTCCECKQDIYIGEEYTYIKGLWEDKFEEYRRCEKCQVILDKIYSEYNLWEDEFPPLGELYEWCKNEGFDISEVWK